MRRIVYLDLSVGYKQIKTINGYLLYEVHDILRDEKFQLYFNKYWHLNGLINQLGYIFTVDEVNKFPNRYANPLPVNEQAKENIISRFPEYLI